MRTSSLAAHHGAERSGGEAAAAVPDDAAADPVEEGSSENTEPGNVPVREAVVASRPFSTSLCRFTKLYSQNRNGETHGRSQHANDERAVGSPFNEADSEKGDDQSRIAQERAHVPIDAQTQNRLTPQTQIRLPQSERTRILQWRCACWDASRPTPLWQTPTAALAARHRPHPRAPAAIAAWTQYLQRKPRARLSARAQSPAGAAPLHRSAACAQYPRSSGWDQQRRETRSHQ